MATPFPADNPYLNGGFELDHRVPMGFHGTGLPR
jgi:hypothetical protein